jgi:trimethylamine:corrinoid methyltransferase-like protein
MGRISVDPIQKKYYAFVFSQTHKTYKAAWLAAGSPLPEKNSPTPWLEWGKKNMVPLSIMTFEQWIAEKEKPAAPRLIVAEMAAAPAFYLNPFDDEALWEAVQQKRAMEAMPQWWLC